MDYYYSGEMRSDHTVSSGLIYDGETDQRRDNRRRSVTVEHVDNRNILDFIKETHFYNQL